MTKEKIKYSIMSVISIVLFVLLAMYAGQHRITESTDIIMPATYIVDGITYWYVMLLGVVGEMIIIKYLLNENYFKSATLSLFTNSISGFLGLVTIYIANLIVELMFVPLDLLLPNPISTFHAIRWIFDFAAVVFMNAAIEGLIAKIGFKYKFKKIYMPLCLANAVSLVVCFLFNTHWIEQMYF